MKKMMLLLVALATLIASTVLAAPADIWETGQKTCYDTGGSVVPCTGTGQDGDLQPGVAWPTPRFSDNGNGAVTDNLTGLIWLKNADCFSLQTWDQALADSNGLANGSCGLSDGSAAGDWRLPNLKELLSLVDFEYNAPALSNAAGTAQWSSGDPFDNVHSSGYWSSTTYPLNTVSASDVNVWVGGYVNYAGKTVSIGVWPVRGGVFPTLGTLTPSVLTSAPAIAQSFSAVYSDADGYLNIKQAYLRVYNTANGIYLRYDRTTNKLYLYNDAGTAPGGGCTPGIAGTLTNTQGSLNCAATTVAGSGNNLTIKWNITPKAAFASATKKNLYMLVRDMSNITAGWTDKGDWTIKATNVAPTLGTLTPSVVTSAAGAAQSFSAVYSDADGYGNIKQAYLRVHTVANGIYLRYDRTTNKLYLYNDTGTTTVGSCTPKVAGTLTNTQGSLNCAATTVAGSGNNLTIKWNITPKAAFANATKKNLYMLVRDMSNLKAGWTDKGDWTITP